MGNPDVRRQILSEGKIKRLRSQLLDYERTLPLTRQAQALSDPTRLSLLAVLLEAGETCVSDLCVVTEREQSGVSRHLRILWDAGLVDKYRRDFYVFYSVTKDGERLLAALLDA
jgi:ArsR family transcriptional regulator, lead/cadmium/zinc/bismuth-responsive transcriptional repressor